MIEVTSGDVLAMQDSAFADVLADLNQKHKQLRLSALLPWLSIAVIVIFLAAFGADAAAVLLLLPFAWAIGHWVDSFKRAAVLFYEVDDGLQQRFVEICEAFDGLAACAGLWHIEAGKAVGDLATWKQQAGASHLVRRSATTLNYRLPDILKCNLTPPALRVGKRTIFLLRTLR
ncbi:hypothetical protein [Novosphingobium sp.]|uniref:hypothetical protein n=1 Tax=Novosphingobium sp. TaxID=1874826 RepID=UPI0038B94FF0